MPEKLIQRIKKYHDKKWEEINSIDAPFSGVGTMSDLYRFQMGLAEYLCEDYPRYEDEIIAIVCGQIKV